MPQRIQKTSDHPTLLACVIVLILIWIPYGVVNHLPLDRYVIPFILGEQHIPFLPWTFLIYVSIYAQYIIVMRSLSKVQFRRFFFLMMGMIGIAVLFFIFLPIQYPRELYPSSNILINFFRGADGAGNCFPSLHVAATVFLASCYAFAVSRRSKRILMWIWTVAIVLSVLTTKQHYVVDVFGGIALAIPAAILFTTQERQKKEIQ